MNNMYLYGLKDENGNLFSFALGLDPVSLLASMSKDIADSLTDLKSQISLVNYNQVLSYLELLKNSAIVKVLHFSLVEAHEVESYYETIALICDNLDLVNLIDNLIDKCLSYIKKEVD